MRSQLTIARRRLIKTGLVALVALAWWSWPAPAHAAALPAPTTAALQQADLIYVATRRRTGALSAIKPIWFMYVDGKIFFTTAPESWKARRIAAGSALYIWVGGQDGPFVEGRAEPVTDPAFIERMGEAYAQKYWIAWLGLFKPRASRVQDGRTNAYLVTLTAAPPPAAPQ